MKIEYSRQTVFSLSRVEESKGSSKGQDINYQINKNKANFPVRKTFGLLLSSPKVVLSCRQITIPNTGTLVLISS